MVRKNICVNQLSSLSCFSHKKILSVEVKGDCITIHIVVSLANTNFFRQAFISTSVGGYFSALCRQEFAKYTTNFVLSYTVPDTNIKRSQIRNVS